MSNPLAQDSAAIEQILRSGDGFTVNRLMQAYDISPDKPTYVAALIHRLLVEVGRHQGHTNTDAQGGPA